MARKYCYCKSRKTGRRVKCGRKGVIKVCRRRRRRK